MADAGLHELPEWIGSLPCLAALDLRGNRLTRLPDSLANLTSLTQLDLRGNMLAEVPDWVGNLTSLTSLDLSNNRLLELPASLERLTVLANLNVGGNDIGALPEFLQKLTGLRRLGLARTELQLVPGWLGDLTGLRFLDISGNHFRDMPESLGALASLETLSLNNADLGKVPSWLRALTRLQALSLSGNQLAGLPSWLGDLHALSALHLSLNRLCCLPGELSRLTALTTLDLGSNRLAEVPGWLASLTSLTVLDLSGNRLIALPDSIGNLSALTVLDLSGNQLTALPDSIGNLSALTVLDLSGNRLTTLPAPLGKLVPQGIELSLRANPLAGPVRDFARRGANELAVYLRSLYDGEAQYEGKLLLVGEGNVGKTSLIAALKGDPFVSGRPTTHGIEISPLGLRHPVLDTGMTLRAWDFGGQEIYRVTHQFFFSPRAVYLVVWHARQGQEQDEVEGWLRRIHLRVGRDAFIMLVATHCAERLPELDYPLLKENFAGKLELAGSFETDSFTGGGVPELREAIRLAAARLPQMGELISPRWTAAREEIMNLASIQPHIGYDQFVKICEQHNVIGEEIPTLAKLMHDLGLIIYYGDDEGLRDIVVLNPEWLTKAISYVLEDDQTRQAGGVLDHERLREIWQNPKDGYLPEYYPYFLRLMEKFDVSYRLDDEGHSLISQRVPFQRPVLPWQPGSTPDDPLRSMRFVCRLAEPAPGLIPWLIVRHHRASTGAHWQRGMFLRHPIGAYASEAILEARSNVELAVEIRAPSPDLYFNVLRDSIETLIMQRWPGLRYDLLVPCLQKTRRGAPCPGSFSMDGLWRIRERGQATRIPCQTCGQVSDIFALLTGFAVPGQPLTAAVEQISRQVADVNAEISDIRGLAADIANTMRRVHRVISTEVTDCPRMFTVARARPAGARRARVHERHYRLTLWCEHPEYPHPWTQAAYDIDPPKEWFTRASRYMRLVFRVLQLVDPLAGTLAMRWLPEGQLSYAKTCLAEMEAILANIPGSPEPGISDTQISRTAGHLTIAEGDGLRAFRSLLFENDPGRTFGGLRRVQNETGELRWVCSRHYGEYDPGLPRILQEDSHAG